MSKVNLFDYTFKVLEAKDNCHFDCGDPDLTEFFLVDAIPHKRVGERIKFDF